MDDQKYLLKVHLNKLEHIIQESHKYLNQGRIQRGIQVPPTHNLWTLILFYYKDIYFKQNMAKK